MKRSVTVERRPPDPAETVDDARAQSLLGAAAHQPDPFRPSSPPHSLRAKTFGEVG